MPNLNNRFAVAPAQLQGESSVFDMPYTTLTTGNFGKVIPFYWQEVMPGDTFDVTTRLFARMSTPLYPVMDNAWVNVYYFFVPNRLVWTHWPEFLGENKYSAWAQNIDYIVPHAPVIPEVGSLYDHLGVPTYTDDMLSASGLNTKPQLDISFLLPRAYRLIWNEWFRNENTTDPLLVNTGDDVDVAEVQSYQALLNASKPFDAFTSALPSPQKGDAVDIPLSGNAPVRTSPNRVVEPTDNEGYGFAIQYKNTDPNAANMRNYLAAYISGVDTDGNGVYNQGLAMSQFTNASSPVGIGAPVNLYADMSDVSAATINQLRQAFQMQRLLELQARAGSRYTEIIKASFGVTSPDARLQRPEYLGGTKVDIQMQQVAQTSATNDESPLGKVGAYSKTVSVNRDFVKSFAEHGYVIGVMVARHALTYQQGLHKMWSRRGRFDYYWPTFANIGEQPILRKELYATGDPASDDLPFGYQEAWYEYRYKPNEISGMFRSTVNGSLDEWHYGDFYSAPPLLSDGWMAASDVNVDRTLAVSSALHDQLLFDIRVDCKATRPMPLYSIPGLIDHF